MRLVRLGEEPTDVGADIRASVSAWGAGGAVHGGVAVFGCTPPGGHRPLDAVLVLPRGVIVVVGVDLSEPALKLEAPLHTPWVADGWPLVRTEGAVNPALEAVESASALARSLQSRGVEPLPVATIIAVGPFVGQVTQPTNDLHRGVRVLHPSTTTMLSAARELATYQHACPAASAKELLRVLDERAGELDIADLTAEGFPDVVAPDYASADTMLITRVGDRPGPLARLRPALKGLPQRAKLIALSLAVLVVLGVVALLVASRPGATHTAEAQGPAVRVDGVEFVRKASVRDNECVRHSYGDVQLWFQQRRCTVLTRAVFDTAVSKRRAAVAVTLVDLSDEASAAELRTLLNKAGTGGVTDLIADGRGWLGAPSSFDGSAQSVEQTGHQVRIVRTAWSQGLSVPDDVGLRALAERGMRLPASP